MSLLNPFSWFKKEEEQEYPGHFAIVSLNPIAKQKGMSDDFNKEINIYKNGLLVETIPYTRKTLEIIREMEEIPIYEEDFNEDEEFEFDSYTEQGVIKFKK